MSIATSEPIGKSFFFSQIQNRLDANPEPRDIPWPGFFWFCGLMSACVRDDKNSLPAFIPARFGERRNANGNLRHNANVEEVTALVLDLDGKDASYSAADLEVCLSGHEYIAYTTFSSSLQEPRWRIILPLALPLAPECLGGAFLHVQKVFGIATDPQAKDPSRLFYLPVRRLGRESDFRLLRGTGRFLEIPENGVGLSETTVIVGKRTANGGILNKCSNSTVSSRISYSTHTNTNSVPPARIGNLPEPTPDKDGNFHGWYPHPVVFKLAAIHQPKRIGERNRRLLDYVRALQRINVEWDTFRARIALKEWFVRAQHVIATKDWDTNWFEFLDAWERCPAQFDRLDVERLRKDSMAISLPSTLQCSDKAKTLLKACVVLQRWHGGDFYLSHEDAGRLLGLSRPHTSKILRRCCSGGFLKLIDRGDNIRGVASTYRLAIIP